MESAGFSRRCMGMSVSLREKEEYKEVLKLLRSGYPIRKVAKLTDVSESTIKRLKKEFGI